MEHTTELMVVLVVLAVAVVVITEQVVQVHPDKVTLVVTVHLAAVIVLLVVAAVQVQQVEMLAEEVHLVMVELVLLHL